MLPAPRCAAVAGISRLPDSGPGAALTRRYAAFISYNHRDRRTAAWLHRALETYRIPKRLQGRETPFGPLGARLPPSFQDREDLAAGSSLADSVSAALAQSGALVVVCTPSGAASKWVNEEIRAFTALGRRDHLQCLIAAGIPNAAHTEGVDPALECLPPALFENGGSEPMAADIRPGMDGRRAALLKLIAGITGIGYDELRQREAQRRARHLVIIAVAATIGFVAMSALAMAAMMSRSDALAQRDIARQKTLTAERTVDFVKSLFAVSDPSESRGQTITAREILDRGARQIETGLAREPAVKAELTTTLGEVYTGLGLYREGNRLVSGTLALPDIAPATRARQFAALGDGLALQGDYRAALKAFAGGLVAARSTGSDHPELVTRILIGSGEAQSALDDFTRAEGTMREALALDLKRVGPEHPDVARDLEAIGTNAVFAGRYADAGPPIERALAIRLKTQGQFHPKVSQDLNALGAIAYFRRDGRASEDYYRRALAIGRRVLGPDHPDVAIIANSLARDIIERRGFAEADALLGPAVAASLRQRPATNDDMAFMFANLAIARRGLGKPAEAEALFLRALLAAETHKHRNRGPIMIELADLACDRDDAAAGLARLAAAAPLVAADYPGDPWRSSWLGVVRARCLAAAGRDAEAQAEFAAAAPPVRERWPAAGLYGARLAVIGKLLRAR